MATFFTLVIVPLIYSLLRTGEVREEEEIA